MEENQQEPVENLNKTKITKDENGNKIIMLRQMTKLEKQYFDEARQKHKQNIVQKQVVMGKAYEGQAFKSDPEKIIFDNFAIGETYVQKVKMTNQSNTLCSFKLLPLKESIRDFFEIQYKPQGRISSGMSSALTIIFHPQVNEDIDEFFSILAETGQIDIPLICRYQKAVVRCESTVVDFGDVINGESGTKILKLTNEGALSTELTIKSKSGHDIMTKTEITSQMAASQLKQSQLSGVQEQEARKFEEFLSYLKFIKQYKINGQTTLNIPITYTPKIIGSFELPLTVYIDNYLHSPPISIIIRGNCINEPIYVEKSLYDFEICLFNHIYREKIVFYNRGNKAMKIQIEQPSITKKFFEFNPMLGYIQGKTLDGDSKFEIWVKFTADKDIMALCQKYIVQKDILSFPFQLIGADQVNPVKFDIKSKLTIDTVQINPGKINFGRLYEGTAARVGLSLENQSELPQQLIFYPLPKEVSVEPDLIPIKLLPRENLGINMIYRSQEVKGLETRKDEGYLHCKIITGTIATHELRIPYATDIVKCPLDFEAKKIDIQALQIDEVFSTSINIANIASKDIIFEFFVPEHEICGLKINPMVAVIKAKTKIEIFLEYTSKFRKLKPDTLEELKKQSENDPKKNFYLRLKQMQETEEAKKQQSEQEQKQAEEDQGKQQKKDSKKQDKKQEAQQKKPEKLTKQQQQQLEEQLKQQEEQEKQKAEEIRLAKLEKEKNFNMKAELSKLGGKLEEFGEENEQNYSQHYTWLIPCYFKFVDSPDSSKFHNFIEVNTVSVQKSLVLSQTVIDFGEVAVGLKENKEITISNKSDAIVEYKKETLPYYSGFEVINASRKIAPKDYVPGQSDNKKKSNTIGQSDGEFSKAQGDKTLSHGDEVRPPINPQKIVIQFQPFEDREFKETLVIVTQTTRVSAQLKGRGVRPEVEVSQKDGLLKVGGVILGESCEKSFKVINISTFPVKFQVASKARGIQNINSSEVFSYIPSQARIEPNTEIEIKVTFKPDRINENFFELISIDVPNQKSEKRLFIWGYCYQRSAYISYYKPYLELPKCEDLPKKIEAPFDFLRLKDEESIFSIVSNKIMLEFTKVDKDLKVEDKSKLDEKCFVRKITIGNCKVYSDSKLEKPVQFEVSMPKDDKNNYFTCDNMKTAVNSGTEIVVSFKFTPPKKDEFIADVEALKGIGQWREMKAEAKLSGGFCRQGIADLWSFEIILRAYIDQI